MKKESPLKWVMNFVDLCSGILDNLVYLNRIKFRPYSTKWQEKWVDWLGSAASLSFVILSILEKIIAVYREAIQKYDDSKFDPSVGRKLKFMQIFF